MADRYAMWFLLLSLAMAGLAWAVDGAERAVAVLVAAMRPSWLPAGQRSGGCDAITFGRRPGAVWHYLACFVNSDV